MGVMVTSLLVLRMCFICTKVRVISIGHMTNFFYFATVPAMTSFNFECKY
jgi:hypothetical protein